MFVAKPRNINSLAVRKHVVSNVVSMLQNGRRTQRLEENRKELFTPHAPEVRLKASKPHSARKTHANKIPPKISKKVKRHIICT